MIQLSSSAILILHPDASTELLDPDEIQTRIIRACIASGETDSWIAGDLALAVEFALLNAEKRMIRQEELDRMIAVTLEDAGYPAVAAEFKRTAGAVPPEFLPVDQKNITAALQNHIALEPEQFQRMTVKVQDALTLLGLSHASQNLMLELARQFRDTGSTVPAVPLPEQRTSAKSGSIILKKEEFLDRAAEQTASFLRARVLRTFHISRLFSALRLELSLTAFAELKGLPKPVTELAFWSVSGELASAIDNLCGIADTICKERGETETVPLPLVLSVRDSIPFAVRYMDCPADHAVECVKGLMGAFSASLARQPFKVSLQ